MFEPKQFDDLAKKLFSALPTGLQSFENDIEKKFRDLMLAAFNRMELVTREEFDVQTKVLARTREKLDNLQAQVDTLLTENKNNVNE